MFASVWGSGFGAVKWASHRHFQIAQVLRKEGRLIASTSLERGNVSP
jgi:hypothetical protein